MIESIKVEEVNKDGTKTTVMEKDPSTGYHNYLIAFNAVVDLDFSILRMIQKEFNNPKFINQKIMHMTSKEVKYALLNRTDTNPLSICIQDMDIADNIYKEIMTTRYNDLLSVDKYIAITGVFLLASVYSNMENVHVNILCTSKEEEAIVRNYHSKINTLVMKDPSELDLDQFTEFIFKNKNDVFKFKNVFKEKRIIFLNYKFNTTFTEDGPLPEINVSRYLWETGFSKTAIMDTYKKDDPDFATLIFNRKTN